jgi:uncharacterized protein (TIGR00661 family)
MAVAAELRQRGHELQFCCGGTARNVLKKKDEPVIQVPALTHAMEDNRVQVFETIQCNWRTILNASDTIERLCAIFESYDPDLLITDFEAFSPRAAAKLHIPIISFNHQQVITETRYDLPPKHRWDAMLAHLVIRAIAPRNPAHILLTSFFFPPLKHPDRTTLVPPIIREEVRDRIPSEGDHILVYYNHGEGADDVLETLRSVDAPFIVYGFPQSADDQNVARLTMKEPSIDGFLHDLATSRAVICTAGFTLMSEALYLGKPLLVVPNQGIFEQTLNALFLEQETLGEYITQSELTPDRIERFLARTVKYRTRMRNLHTCGNDEAVDCIEEILYRSEPTKYSVSSRSA